jgi:hypothetical protein
MVKRIEARTRLPFWKKTRLSLPGGLESGGVEFIDENGGGPDVRLHKRQREKKPK